MIKIAQLLKEEDENFFSSSSEECIAFESEVIEPELKNQYQLLGGYHPDPNNPRYVKPKPENDFDDIISDFTFGKGIDKLLAGITKKGKELKE